jgi:hypothetical protein
LELFHLLGVGAMEALLEEWFHRADGQVAAPHEPLIVLLDAEHPGQTDQGGVVGEDADDVGAGADLLLKRSSGLVDLSLRQWSAGNE